MEGQVCSKMESGPLLSVVVPVYQTEKYLRGCVESILNSEYQNIQVILIDDGSTDTSPQICDEYVGKDTRIIVRHKKNEGVSSAKNLGIEIAEGMFVTFCDSDDEIPSDAYRLLMQKAIDTSADVVLGNVERIVRDTGDVRVSRRDGKTLAKMVGGHTANIYKKTLLDKYHIRISDTAMGEGFCFMLKVFAYAENLQEIDEVTYHYYIRSKDIGESSAMQRKNIEFRLYYDDFLWRKNFIEQIQQYDLLMKKYYDQLGGFCKVVDKNWFNFNKEQRKKCFEILKGTVELIDWKNQKENVKGYIQVDGNKICKMNERQYTRRLFVRFNLINPLKVFLKKLRNIQ